MRQSPLRPEEEVRWALYASPGDALILSRAVVILGCVMCGGEVHRCYQALWHPHDVESTELVIDSYRTQ